jgi:hypothetical protein
MVPMHHSESVFEPEAAQAMSHVFDDICASLHIPNSADKPRELIAKRIIEIARQGEREAKCLRDWTLRDFPELIARLEGCGELHG